MERYISSFNNKLFIAATEWAINIELDGSKRMSFRRIIFF